jgi:DNA-binding transcriptional regulator YiaG
MSMRFEGTIWRNGKYWLVEVPALDAMTQGRSKREAYAMIEDLVKTMADAPDLDVRVLAATGPTFELGASDSARLVALMLRRQREKHGLSLAEAARRLGQTSRNAYARYEQGRAVPTVDKLQQLLEAVAPDQHLVWRLTA